MKIIMVVQIPIICDEEGSVCVLEDDEKWVRV